MAKQKQPDAAPVASLSTALAFAKPAIRDIGEPYQTHVILYDGTLFAYDGTIAVGHPIAEASIRACPQGTALRAALARCREAVALGVVDGALSLRSGPLKVHIPCIDFGLLPAFAPDPVGMAIDDTIKQGFAVCAPLVTENAETVLQAALKLSGNSMVATNRATMVEYWHGFLIPRECLLPKAAVRAVMTAPYKLTGFGCSASSCTFYFENGAWIKTQLFAEPYPDTNPILNKKTSPKPLAEGFSDGVKSILPFANEAGYITYGLQGLSAGEAKALGSTYDIQGIADAVKFSGHQWLLIGQHIKEIDWLAQHNGIYFFGERLRGAITKIGI